MTPRRARGSWCRGSLKTSFAVLAKGPAGLLLPVAPELDKTDLMVIAYRLRREIERKTIACGERNEYFLTPINIGQSAAVEAQVLASSKMHNISLVTLLSEKPAIGDEGCLRKFP